MVKLTPNKGTPKYKNTTNNRMAIKIKERDQELSDHFKFLNFRENIGISETINRQKIINKTTRLTST